MTCGGAGPACDLAPGVGRFFGYDETGRNGAAPPINLNVRFASQDDRGARMDIVAGALPSCAFIDPTPGACVTATAALLLIRNEVVAQLPDGLNDLLGVPDALARTSVPNVNLPSIGLDLGTLPVAVNAEPTGAFPAFTAPFGAPGGLWGPVAAVGIERGLTLTAAVGPTVTITPSPELARLLTWSPYVANEVRRVFAEPILSEIATRRTPPPLVGGPARLTNAVMVGVSPIPDPLSTGDTAAQFVFRLDRDGDGFDDVEDYCNLPDVASPTTGLPLDTDGDGLSDACDLCPGVLSRGVGDRDADLIPDPCDCDRDGDGCPEFLQDALYRGAGGECASVGVPDRDPRSVGIDTDGDGTPDDCDFDSDDDGVPDPVRGADGVPIGDNCPYDFNPDQLNSGGTLLGDACDPLCPGPRAPGCTLAGSGAFLPPPSDELPAFGELACLFGADGGCEFLAGIDLCLRDGPGCDFGIELFTPRFRSIDAVSLPNGAELATAITAIPDRDGDGIEELVVGRPFEDVCGDDGCLRRAGRVRAIASATGDLLFEVSGTAVGERLGQSVASLGDFLVVGAPGARNSRGIRAGAVRVLDLGWADPLTVTTISGDARGDKLGTAIVLASDRDGDGIAEFLASAPGASGQAGRESGRVDVYSYDGVRLARFEGTSARARLGDDASVILPRDQNPSGVLIGASRSGVGGAVTFFTWTGRAQWTLRGNRGDDLGAALAPTTDLDRDGVAEVVVGAPGANRGRGALLVLNPFGVVLQRLEPRIGRRFGARLSVPGDLDGDGRDELFVSYFSDRERRGMSLLFEGAGKRANRPTGVAWAP